MRTLAVFGGCSKSGKSTLIFSIAQKHGVTYGRKFQLVQDIAELDRGSSNDLIANYDGIERKMFDMLLHKPWNSEVFLLDQHYAIQPCFDTQNALDRPFDENLEEPYALSTNAENIRHAARLFDLKLIFLSVDAQTILHRRQSFSKTGARVRSLSPLSIALEQRNEYEMFLRFYGIAHDVSQSVTSYVIESSGDIEQSIANVERIIGLDANPVR